MIFHEIEIERSQTLCNVGQCNARLFQILGIDPQANSERGDRRKKAERAFIDSLKISRPNDWRAFQTRSRQAWLHCQEEQWPLAKREYTKALEGLSKNPFECGHAHWGLAKVLLRIKPPEYDAAFKSFDNARDIFGIGYARERIEVSMEAARAEQQLGRLGEAERRATEAWDFVDTQHLTDEEPKIRDFLDAVRKLKSSQNCNNTD